MASLPGYCSDVVGGTVDPRAHGVAERHDISEGRHVVDTDPELRPDTVVECAFGERPVPAPIDNDVRVGVVRVEVRLHNNSVIICPRSAHQWNRT